MDGGRGDFELVGAAPAALRTRELAKRRTAPLTLLVTPRAGAVAAVAERYPRRGIVVLSTVPSAVEAALLIHAGADAYVDDPVDVRPAIDSLDAGEAWLSPVGATAVCRLARLPGDPAYDALAALARAAAEGRGWTAARAASGLVGTRATLATLRQLV